MHDRLQALEARVERLERSDCDSLEERLTSRLDGLVEQVQDMEESRAQREVREFHWSNRISRERVFERLAKVESALFPVKPDGSLAPDAEVFKVMGEVLRFVRTPVLHVNDSFWVKLQWLRDQLKERGVG